MEGLLFLAGLVQKSFISIPGSTFLMIIVVLSLLFWGIFGSRGINIVNIEYLLWAFLLGISVLIFQVLALYQTNKILLTKLNMFHAIAQVGALIVSIFLYFTCVMISLNRKKNIQRFVAGNLTALAPLLFICYLQLGNIINSSKFNSFLSLSGRLFEERNEFRPDWYIFGSYTQTMHRVNGFYAESGFLASILIIVFCPFILSAIKNKVNIFFPKFKYSGALYSGLLLAIIIILLGAKTSTGIFSVLLIFILLILNIKGKQKVYWILGSFIMLTACFIGYNEISFITVIFNDYIFSKGSGSESTMMRLGGTLASIKTIMQHPVLGVGLNQTSYFNFLNSPEFIKGLSEYQLLTATQTFGDQNVIFSFIAQFGLFIGGGVIAYIVKLKIELKQKKKILEQLIDTDSSYYTALLDSGDYYIGILLVMSILSFNWSYSLILLMLIFYIGLNIVLKEYREK